jgi:hypothetical protein
MMRAAVAIVVLSLAAPVMWADEPFRFPEATHGKGELKYRSGIPVLVAVGTPEEIGEQIGALAVKPVAGKMKALVDDVLKDKVGPAWPIVVKACEGLFKQFPEEYRTEVEATAKAGGIDVQVLVIANTIGDIQHLGGCSALVVEPARSATGQLLCGRNMDSAPIGSLAQLSLVIVRRSTGKRAFASVAFPGTLVNGGEMNDAGLTLFGNDVRESKDDAPKINPKGTPMAVAARRLMEGCADLAEAEKYLKGVTVTTSGSAIICDTKAGVVYEVTAKSTAVRRAEDGICACTNHFRTKELAVGPQPCWRYEKLEAYWKRPKLGVADVSKALHEVNQDKWTIQSMVFEPAAVRMHLAFGDGPVTARERKTLECGPLLGVSAKPR